MKSKTQILLKKAMNFEVQDEIRFLTSGRDFSWCLSRAGFKVSRVNLKKTTLWPLFMDGVQLPQG